MACEKTHIVHSEILDRANMHPSKDSEGGTCVLEDQFAIENSTNLELSSFTNLKKKKKKSFESTLTDSFSQMLNVSSGLTDDPNVNMNVTSDKKKKSNKVPQEDDSKDSKLHSIPATSLNLDLSNEMNDDDNMNFDPTKKKKRSSKKVLHTEEDLVASHSGKKLSVLERLWGVSDSDYTYDYLLSRFFRISKTERPCIEAGSTLKLTIKPPLIFRIGSKKTSFANFLDICRILHRPPQHFMSFILAELGTSGSVDGNNHLVIKGRFQQNQIENVIRRYIKDYVKCFTCNSMNTVMQKEVRLNFLMCENCESRRSVTSIKSGFQAVTGKRAAMRAKTVP